MGKSFTIGVAGGSGSGKTRFLTELAARFEKGKMCFVSMDHYYKPRDLQPIDKNGFQNFDLPESIDRSALVADILKLKEGKEVTRKEYTFNNPNARPAMLKFSPAPILVIEGLFIQYFEEVAKELDLKLFIEAKDHLKLGRRIKRDNEERGYDLDDVLYRYEHHTMPVYEQLIAPLMHSADFVIPNNSDFKAAVEVLAGYLQAKSDDIAF